MAKKKVHPKKVNNKPLIIVTVIFILVTAVVFAMTIPGKSPQKEEATKTQGQSSTGNQGQSKTETVSGVDLKIAKNEVTETAKFYPYKVANVTMEVFAVKAKDGTIRTALNTCQVCYGSGRGYYIQEGDTLVCQNCGNVFDVDQIEKVRNGCNPVPVGNENKKDNGNDIVISKTFMEENKALFLKWKK